MTRSQKVITARESLGLSQSEVSAQTGISIHEICDIEQHEHEVFTTTDVTDVKKLFSLLEIDFMAFFNIDCIYCSGVGNLYEIGFNDLVEKKMAEKGMTSNDLADAIGFDEVVLDKIKHDKSYLNKWSLELVTDYSKSIDIPIQILLDLTCRKCGK